MNDAASQLSRLRFAMTLGTSSVHLSALLALQRAEEPEVVIALSQVSDEELAEGLQAGRFDAGLSFLSEGNPSTEVEPLLADDLAVALPPGSPLLRHEKLLIVELLDYPVFLWQAESCPALDKQLSTHSIVAQHVIQRVKSFEMMTLQVAADFGVGVSARFRIEHAHAWGVGMRPICDGPYQVVTYLHSPADKILTPRMERFRRRAQIIVDAHRILEA